MLRFDNFHGDSFSALKKKHLSNSIMSIKPFQQMTENTKSCSFYIE